MVAYVYDNSQCNPADITETNFGVADVCKVPTNDYGDTTDIDKQMASAYRLATCNAPSGLPNYEDIGYYSTYFFAGTECDSNELVSVDVVTTGECIQQTDSTYLKYFCGKQANNSTCSFGSRKSLHGFYDRRQWTPQCFVF